MESVDTVLISQCQAGDADAFGGLVKKYAGPATGAAYVLLRNTEDARDASQEAFVRAWRAIKRFRTGAPFYPWYAAILRNVCISRLRRKSRRREYSLSEGNADDHAENPGVLAERNERADRVWRAVLALSEAHREIVVLNHFQSMSYKEISSALSIPIGTVMSRLHSARNALREKLKGESP